MNRAGDVLPPGRCPMALRQGCRLGRVTLVGVAAAGLAAGLGLAVALVAGAVIAPLGGVAAGVARAAVLGLDLVLGARARAAVRRSDRGLVQLLAHRFVAASF